MIPYTVYAYININHDFFPGFSGRGTCELERSRLWWRSCSKSPTFLDQNSLTSTCTRCNWFPGQTWELKRQGPSMRRRSPKPSSLLSVLVKEDQDNEDKMAASQSSHVSTDQNYPDEALAWSLASLYTPRVPKDLKVFRFFRYRRHWSNVWLRVSKPSWVSARLDETSS